MNLFGYWPNQDVQEVKVIALRLNLKSVVASAAWIDPIFARNKLVYDIMLEMGGFAPRIWYTNMTISGVYHGYA